MTERADLTGLGRQLRLEMQYALQCRRDECGAGLRPATIRSAAAWLAASGAGSVLDRSEAGWRAARPASIAPKNPAVALVAYLHRRVSELADPPGWDGEYPRDTWRLRRLGIDGGGTANLRFAGITQPWLKELAKRWIRWRLSSGTSASVCSNGARAIAHFSGFLATAGITRLAQVSRPVLERYLAEAAATLAGTTRHSAYLWQLSTFLHDLRRHQWDAGLPGSAMIFPADCPRKERSRVPRALAEHIMSQLESPAVLDCWDDPEWKLVTIILIRCGLRVSDAVKIPFDCLARDAGGTPYLKYRNRKMRREALVPLDDEAESLIRQQQQRVRQRWTASPVLFPGRAGNLSGRKPASPDTYRDALYRWLDRCDITDEYGQPVHLTPHQWRHTLGTRLINRDVPQHVVQKILDHDSAEMTAHYARLSDKTVREHWERARKVNAEGQPVQISPGGPLGDAAWAKQQLSRATQALPNGYCQLPLVKTCPHANSCLTCPMFLTTADFLPQHHAQRQQTLQIITAAEAAGHARVAEMNRQVAGNLDKIIATLEDEGTDGKKATASAP